MKRNDIGVAVRDYYMVAGYWGKWLVAISCFRKQNYVYRFPMAPMASGMQ